MGTKCTFPMTTVITAHAWNADCSMLALCPNNNELHIYKRQGTTFRKAFTLKEHDQIISGIDWGFEQNRIVTCSHDRNAYVWEFADNQWTPTLVILRLNRSATKVKWSPLENKFAVSSGAKCISVCFYASDNNWWVSKHIKKNIRSTVTGVSWHPDNSLIAASSSDFKCRLFAAAIRRVDKKPAPNPWGEVKTFGSVVAEFDFLKGWVKAVSFSPSGNKLGFVGHDSSVCVVEAEGNVSTVRTKALPYQSLVFLNENQLVAAGHECAPILFSGEDGGEWAQEKTLDTGTKKAEKKVSSTMAARARFQQADKLGATGGDALNTSLKTIHQNSISEVRAMTYSGDAVTEFSTVGTDGALVLWKSP